MNQESKTKKYGSFSHAVKFIMGVLSWTIFVILILVAAFLLYYFISTKIYAEKGEKYRPAIGLYTILTGSMEPNINRYDVIVDKTVKNPEDIKVGDVITFVSTSSLTKGMVITHRVVNVKNDANGYSYQTKGDANLSPDTAYVPFANVQGKVLFKIPQLGRLQSFLATKGGWLIVVVIPALIIIISDLLKVFRLMGAKNKVDDLQSKEEKHQNMLQSEKKKIELNLQRKYSIVRKSTDPDPIPHKKYNIVKKENASFEHFNAPDDMDLPKLKK